MKKQTSPLISQLAALPSSWRFVPINGNKQPLGREWQNTPLTIADFVEAEKSGSFSKLFFQPKGSTNKQPVPFKWMQAVGILCGEPSGGNLCFDHDGHSCDPLIEKLSGRSIEEALPKTVRFHAGKPGHYQAVYSIPQMYWGAIASKRILTGVQSWNKFKQKNEDEQIDLRWTGGQSVILGAHPETGGYKWVEGCSPAEVAVAECPQWIIEQMLGESEEQAPKAAVQPTLTQSSPLSDREWALSYLEFIRNDDLDWYSWRDVLLALHKAGVTEGEARSWSADSSKHTDKGFDQVWRYIDNKGKCVGLGTLGMLAKKNGWKSPKSDRNPAPNSIKTTKEAIECLSSQASGYAALRLAIADALAHRDPLEKEWRFYEIASKFSRPRSFIDRIVRDITARHEFAKKTEFNLKDLLNLGSQGVEWLIPRFMPKKGLTLLGGFAKDGKSTLTYEMIAALLTGRPFLGETPTRRARVLMIQLEEGEDKIRQRLEGVGVLHDPEVMLSDAIHIKREWAIDDLDQLEQWIVEHRIDVVVIDSLRAASRSMGVDENSAAFANPVYALQAFLNKTGIAGFLIHHFNKSKEAVSAEKFAGSSAIVGAADNLHLLIRESQDQNSMRRRLDTKGRDCNGLFQIEYHEGEFPEFHFEVTQEICDPEIKSFKARILEVLEINRSTHPEGFRAADFVELMGLPPGSKSIYKALKALAAEKRISCTREGENKRVQRYSLPEISAVSTPPYPNQESGYYYSKTQSESDLQLVSTVVSNPQTDRFSTPMDTNSEWPVEPLDPEELADDLVSTSDFKAGKTNVDTNVDTSCNSDPVRIPPGWYSRNPIQEGGGGVPATDVGGYVKYRKDCPPATKQLPADSVSEVWFGGSTYKVGDRVLFEGQSRQIERIEMHDNMPRLHVGLNQWVSVSQVLVNPPAGSQQVVTEVEGFKVGDRVQIAIDHLDEWSQKEVIKNNEAPVGATGVIEAFVAPPSGLGVRTFVPIVRLENGEPYKTLPSYLRKI